MLCHTRNVFVASAIVRAAMACVFVFLLSPTNALARSPAWTLDEATRRAEQRAPMLDARRAGISAARKKQLVPVRCPIRC